MLFFNPQLRVVRPPREALLHNQEEERLEVLRNRQLINQQNNEYAEALAADKAKREERARQQAILREEESRAELERQKVIEKKNRLEKIREEIREKLPVEPTPESTEEIVRVRIKFYNGEFLNRNFLETDSLEVGHIHILKNSK